ncbi:MAG: hypothetical protein UX89_C0006G0011 [Parcubacteria group bacterium GW2011_GWA2_47_16]|nr:MAG: hypothetical protein UX89_C0006G0011 [Parcubacteria group bacterium GW2011_GWA2_47_16]
MFNLLPQQDQRNLASDYRLRFCVVALLLFCSLGIIAFAALAPSFAVSHQKEALIKKNIDDLRSDSVERSKDRLADTLAFTAKEIRVLGSVGSNGYIHEIIDEIIQSKTRAIKLTGIQVSHDGGGRDIVLRGEAGDRDALLAFARSLEKEKTFESVKVPPSNFAPATDISFSIFIKTK